MPSGHARTCTSRSAASPATASSRSARSTTCESARASRPRSASAIRSTSRCGRAARRTRWGWDEPVGQGPPGLAHRVLGHVDRVPGARLRRALRRHGSHLPAPRERDRAERGGAPGRGRRSRRSGCTTASSTSTRRRWRSRSATSSPFATSTRATTPRRSATSCSAVHYRGPIALRHREARRRPGGLPGRGRGRATGRLPLRRRSSGWRSSPGAADATTARAAVLPKELAAIVKLAARGARRASTAALDDDLNTPVGARRGGRARQGGQRARAICVQKRRKDARARRGRAELGARRCSRALRVVGSSRSACSRRRPRLPGADAGAAARASSGSRRRASRPHSPSGAGAREAKDFARADAIRKELDAAGVEIADSPDGTDLAGRSRDLAQPGRCSMRAREWPGPSREIDLGALGTAPRDAGLRPVIDMARDLYAVLGVARDADEDAIKKAFRKLAMKYHPDKSPGKANEAKFKEINQANEVPERQEEARPLRRVRRGEPVAEASTPSARGMMRAVRAAAAAGRRRDGGAGGGVDVKTSSAAAGAAISATSSATSSAARRAGGRAAAREARQDLEATVTIDFVSAVKGTTLELTTQGRGRAGRRCASRRRRRRQPRAHRRARARQGLGGGPPGDLLLTIHVTPHPFFKREGDDLHLDLPITIGEAYRGRRRCAIPTPDGEVTLKVPAAHAERAGDAPARQGRRAQGQGAGRSLRAASSCTCPPRTIPRWPRRLTCSPTRCRDPRVGMKF